jgi:hypothetical protein
MPSFRLDEFRTGQGSGELMPSLPADRESDALAEFPSEARSWRTMPVLPMRLGKRPHLLLPLLAAVVVGAMGGVWWVVADPLAGAPAPPTAPLPSAFLAISAPLTLPPPPESALEFTPPGTVVANHATPSAGAARRTRPSRAAQPAHDEPRPSFPSRALATSPPPRVDETVYADFAAAPPAPAEDSATRIFSAADADVQPPVAARAWFFTAPPEGVSRSFLTQIEVLVSPKGDVNFARIVAGPRTYTDGMILSAIKGGRFRPAQKDGQPVAYRQTLWVVVPDR